MDTSAIFMDNIPMEDDNIYFDDLHRRVFDDDEDVDDFLRSHGRGRTDLRAHLDDLARRHPEFAEHLRSPPGWVSDFQSGSGGGGGGGSSSSNSGQFGTSSSGGGYYEGSEPQSDHHNQQPQQRTPQPPAEQQQPSPAENKRPEDKTTGNSSVNQRPPTGRDHLAQHGLRNTDPEIGLKGQAAVKEDHRNQRSMSAPPDGRSQSNPSDKPQRFVSKIEINPVNPATGETAASSYSGSDSNGSGKPPMAPPKQSQQQQGSQPQHKTSTVRHIPIFVEGRDEPVLPKNIDQEQTVPISRQTPPPQPPPPQQHSYQQFQPPNQQRFNKQQQQPQNKQPQQQASRQPQQSPPQQQQQQHQQSAPENKQQQPQQFSQPQAEKKPKVVNNDPIYRVQLIQQEVDELRKRIEDYKGTARTDKEYIYLDEMLTRNLIKLDDIETEGKENVRAARKEAIKCVQQCISLLESKVPQTPITPNPSSTNLICNNETGDKMDIDEEKTNNVSIGEANSADKQGQSDNTDKQQKIDNDRQIAESSSDKNNDDSKMIVNEEQTSLSQAETPLPQNNSSADTAVKNNDNSNSANINEIKC